MKKNLKNKLLLLFSVALFLAAIIFVGLFALKYQIKINVTSKTSPSNLEAVNLNKVDPSDIPASGESFDQLKTYLQDLANKKGARYAFAVMKQMQPGPNVDMHLLGHAVGDILYKQEGANGITDCDNDFRNACSHSIVIGLFYDKGDAALSEIADACRKAPGGSGAYTMCFHGLGHGILSYEQYDMQKAAAMCQKTGTAQYNYQESAQCVGGMVMEIVDGGGHDPQVWSAARPQYLNPAHPTALCESSYFWAAAKYFCYEYITPYLFEAAGAQAGSPTAADFKKAFTYCLAVPDPQNRNTCFGGFGKEFVGVVQSRNISIEAISKISDDSLKQVYNWCLLANNKTGTAACILDAMNNLYWGGENDYHIALRFCAQVTDDYNQKSCYYGLMQSVSYYVNDPNYKQQFCAAVPQSYDADCKQRLGL